MRWQQKLTKRELAHMREWTYNATLREFRELREKQGRMREYTKTAWPDIDPEPCWDCKMIARKLGIE